MNMKEFFKKIHTDNFTWKDSAIVLMILSELLSYLGSMPSIPISEFVKSTLLSPLAESAILYFAFIPWWIVIFLFCFAVYKYNFVLNSFYKGMRGNTLKMFARGIGIGFFLNSVCALGALLHRDIYLYFDSFKLFSLIIMFVSIFIQAAAEELLYRGWLYQALRLGYRSPWVAVVVNPIPFALGHRGNFGITPLALFNIWLCGVFFSLMVYYFDSLWAAMGIHTAWNFTQNVLFGLPNSGIVLSFSLLKLNAAKATDSFFFNTAFGIEGTGMATVVLSIACIVVILLGRKRKINR